MQASDLFLESGRSSFKARGSGFPVLEGPSLCLTGSEIVNAPKACIDFLGQSRFRVGQPCERTIYSQQSLPDVRGITLRDRDILVSSG